MEQSEAERHAQKMAAIKAARDKIAAARQGEKGLLIVHTGKGKGKSTAAFGMVFRSLGHGLKVGVVQFGKGSRDSGERKALEKFGDQATVFAVGEGFTWETQDKALDIAKAGEAWAVAKAMLRDESYAMVLCDELNIMLRYEYLPLKEVLETLAQRPPMQHAVVTGRNAAPELIEAADLVTEMKLIKHPYRSGIKGQIGVEF